MHQVQLESAQSATRKKIPFILNEQLVNAIEFKSEELWFLIFAFEKDKIQNWLQP